MSPTDVPPHQVPGRRVTTLLIRLEELLLTILLTAMIVLAVYQIGQRWFTSGGLLWIDPLLRYLVLWGGLLGAALATAKNNHISLDVIGYLLPKRLKKWQKPVIGLFSLIVCVFLFRATLLFIGSEIEFGGNDLFGMPNWAWNLIFPIAFGMIGLHFILLITEGLSDIFSSGTRPPSSHA